mgnify:FL=1
MADTQIPGSKGAYYGDLIYGTERGSTPYYGGDTIRGKPIPMEPPSYLFGERDSLRNAISKISKGGSMSDLSGGEVELLKSELGRMYEVDPHVKTVIDTYSAMGGNLGELLSAFALYLRTPRLTNPR